MWFGSHLIFMKFLLVRLQETSGCNLDRTEIGFGAGRVNKARVTTVSSHATFPSHIFRIFCRTRTNLQGVVSVRATRGWTLHLDWHWHGFVPLMKRHLWSSFECYSPSTWRTHRLELRRLSWWFESGGLARTDYFCQPTSEQGRLTEIGAGVGFLGKRLRLFHYFKPDLIGFGGHTSDTKLFIHCWFADLKHTNTSDNDKEHKFITSPFLFPQLMVSTDV